ncbi:MAG: hypothetical protein EOO08_10735 [Chitinophagaceae bacterium]|nr:MAG: hypothetical protein EOO08_10735 [Chitinophagaceae bacterium]
MERVRELIHRITAQEAASESPAALLSSARALVAELEALAPPPGLQRGKSVAVLMPFGVYPAAPVQEQPVAEPASQNHPPETIPPSADASAEAGPNAPEPPAELQQTAAANLSQPPEPSEPSEPSEPPKPLTTSQNLSAPSEPYYIKPPVQTSFFNPIEEVPTLAQQAPQPASSKEVFELHTPGASLHDRLRTDGKEVAHTHYDTPIRDLRKGIALNDRYLFVSELFRGDEAMYERSIKTINAFHILPEAEYWINRELKVKLAWDDSVPTVQHFYGLVRRRFS